MTSLIPRRDPLKNYFPMPNEIFGMGLCAGEIAVYAYLMYRENRKTHQCWPSYATIGSALHMSSNTVRKYVRQLEEKGFIVTEHTKIRTQAGEARNGTLLYTLRPIREPVKQLRDRQWEDSKRELERVRVERLREKRKDTVFEIFSPSREGSRI